MLEKLKKPEIKLQRLKLLVYGELNTGKSTMCASFKDCAFLDTEDVMSKPKYQRLMNREGDVSAVLNIKNLDDISNMITELSCRPHPYKTLVIDSLTVAYGATKEAAEREHGSKYGADSKEANKVMRSLCRQLLNLDMNVIVTCQSKPEYDSAMTVSRQTYDCYSGIGYMFDVVLEATRLGRHFSAIVRKSRLDGFETEDEVKFSYEDVIRRCGIDVIERPMSAPAAGMVSLTPLLELKKLIGITGKEDAVFGWLRKAGCETLDELPQRNIEQCIEFLTKLLNQEGDK